MRNYNFLVINPEIEHRSSCVEYCYSIWKSVDMRLCYLKSSVLFLLFSLLLLAHPCLSYASDTAGNTVPKWMKDRSRALVRVEKLKLSYPRSAVRNGADLVEVTSGVIVTHDGIILTVAHGLSQRAPIVILQDGSRYKSEIITYNGNMDLAVLKINAEKPLPYIPIDFSNEKLGTVWSLGYSEVKKFYIYRGEALVQGINLTSKELTVVRKTGKRTPVIDRFLVLPDLIIHSALIKAGFSGGPLLNSSGELVGVHFGRGGTEKKGLSFSISVRNLPEALEYTTADMKSLVTRLEDSTNRYKWFLGGLEQHFLSEGVASHEREQFMNKVHNTDADIKKSWRQFVSICRQKVSK